MAAILCQSIGQACAGFGDIVGQVLCLPCRACGFACSGIGDLFSSPFFPYSALTFGLNVPPIVLGIKGMMESNCSTIDNWFLINAALCLVHCVACLYIINRIHHDPLYAATDDPVVAATPVSPTGEKRQSFTASVFGGKSEAPTAPPDSNPKKSFTASVFGSKTDESKIESGTYYAEPVQATPVATTRASAVITKSTNRSITDTQGKSMGRIKHVLCYDGGVAIYIIFAIVWMVWQSIGLSRLLAFNSGGCGGQAVASKLVTSLVCGYIYMSLVGIGFFCSLCCLR